MKKTYILFLLFFIGKFINIDAQCTGVTPEQNLNKYWEWRERLKDFVVPGTCQGCSMPSFCRSSSNLSYYDAPEQLGYYIGALATEWYLLRLNTDTGSINQRTRDRSELYYAVNEVYMIDMMAKASWRHYYNSIAGFAYSTADLDGFLIRDNVPAYYPDSIVNGDYVENNLNKGLAPVPDGNLYDANSASSNWTNSGNNGYFWTFPWGCSTENTQLDGAPVLSQDELSQLYIGLALVSKFIPDTLIYNSRSVRAMSDSEEARIYTNALTHGYILENTVTHKCGTGVNWTNAPHFFDECKCAESGSVMGGTWSMGADGLIYSDACIQTHFAPYVPILSSKWLCIYPYIYIGTANEYIMLSLATISNIWGSRTPNIIRRMALKQQRKSHYSANCDIYPLLYEALWGGKVNDFSTSFYNMFMTAAPCHGIRPHEQNYEWGTGNRVDVGIGPNNYSDVYQGCDFLLFFNLYCIAYPVINGSGSYVSYQYVHPKDLRESFLVKTNVDSENNEKNFWAADSIKAGDTSKTFANRRYIIANDNDPKQTLFQGRAQIGFKAGHRIDLVSGFEAKPGVLFDAAIDTSIHVMNCTDCGGDYNVDSMYLPVDTGGGGVQLNYPGIDTLTSLQCGGTFTLNFFGINGDTAQIKSWNWNFGNGQTSTAYNPTATYIDDAHYDSVTHCYDTAYELTVIVKDSLNNMDTLTTYIYLRCYNGGYHRPIKPSDKTTEDTIANISTFRILNSVTENSATVQYYIPQQASVNVTIYSMMGVKIETLVNNITENSGNYSLPFNVSSLPPGMYFITMQAGDFIQTKKLIVVRRQE